MRFKKGSKVEVLSKELSSPGCWRSAEIISGNGHTYSVKYDGCLPNMHVVTERVPRKAIRPCPPPLDCPRSCFPGAIVEVFEKNSWKLAEVSSIAVGNYFFVRLLGSSRDFRAHTSHIRLRQSWVDDKWIVIKKESGKRDNGLTRVGKFICQGPEPCMDAKDGRFHTASGMDIEEPFQKFSGGTKKRPCFHVEECTGAVKKMRIVEKERKCQRMRTKHSSFLLEKVHAVASPQTMLGEKYMHASLYNRTTGYCGLNTEQGKQNGDVGHVLIGSFCDNDSENTSSSVGSCSTSGRPYLSCFHPLSRPMCGLYNHFDDAESVCGSARDLSLPRKEDVLEETRRLELHAYRQTLMALYATGPLSWEQEALLTNLRLLLHISNDEHLSELKHLVSAKLYSS